ncbi:hypothetical protein BJ742DRAFT_856434 [Cladochytrium replicatum]|nr:hypothetical protein BJ742DRAFT_856434 [Cladochytrium replicatum]
MHELAAKLTDFGFAHVKSYASKDGDYKVRAGSPCNMSPEGVDGQKNDLLSGVFSFAMTLYHILRVEPVGQPIPVWDLIQKCCCDDPKDRPRFEEIVSATAEIKKQFDDSNSDLPRGQTAENLASHNYTRYSYGIEDLMTSNQAKILAPTTNKRCRAKANKYSGKCTHYPS